MRRRTSPCRGQRSMPVHLYHTHVLECELGLHLTYYLDICHLQVLCTTTSKTSLNGWLLGVAQPQSQHIFPSVSSCIPSKFEQGSSSLAILKRGRDNVVFSLCGFGPASCPAGRFRRSSGRRRSCARRLDEDVARCLRSNVNLVPGCML